MEFFKAQETAAAIPAGRVTLRGRLHVPVAANGIVLFAHGGGNSRHSPRNQRIGESLHDVGLATLMLDLLPETSEATPWFDARIRDDVALQAGRLRSATRWLRDQPRLAELPVGYFGTNHSAAVVLVAASNEGSDIQAVVTRGGRHDLNHDTISKLRAPTMLIVGANDESVTALNLEVWARLRCEKSIEIIPGAGQRFEEPGALDNVAALAARWFSERLNKDAHVAA
jgi:putative phosphoribosyl transferase